MNQAFQKYAFNCKAKETKQNYEAIVKRKKPDFSKIFNFSETKLNWQKNIEKKYSYQQTFRMFHFNIK